MQLPLTYTQTHMLERIRCRLAAENAASTSDEELDKALSPCVMGHMLLPMAIEFRNAGLPLLGGTTILDITNRCFVEVAS